MFKHASVLCATLAVIPTAFADLTITDSTFSDADWSVVKVQDTTIPADAIGLGQQSATGGFTGAYRTGTHNWEVNSGGVSISFAHLHAGAAWNPAGAGAVTSVSVSFDAICTSAPIVNAVGLGLVAMQNGEFYAGITTPSAAIIGQGWTHFTGTFAQSDFVRMGGGPNNLDFSSSGSPIQFGYYSANGGSGFNARNNASFGVDNFNLTVVPTPGALALAALGALAMTRRRR
jgi:hypothetical protein